MKIIEVDGKDYLYDWYRYESIFKVTVIVKSEESKHDISGDTFDEVHEKIKKIIRLKEKTNEC